MASKNSSTGSEGGIFQVLEGVFYYVDPTTSSNAMNAFVVDWQQRAVGIPYGESTAACRQL